MKLVKQSGSSRAQVAQELGLNANMPGRWVPEFGSGKLVVTPGTALKTERQQEFERLKRVLNRVNTERNILKRAVAYCAKEPAWSTA